MANRAQKTLQLYYHLNGVNGGGGEGGEGGEVDKTDYFYVENLHNGTNTLTLKVNKINFTANFEGYSAQSVEYSTDKTNWTKTPLDSNVTIEIGSGEKVYFRNDNGFWSYIQNLTSIHSAKKYIRFTCSEYFNVGGNIMSLLNYKNIETVNLQPYCFYRMFYPNDKLLNSNALLLPETTEPYCYYEFFTQCKEMISAPTLPAKKLAEYSYYQMFEECYSLNEVTTYANDISASNCTRSWLFRVSDSGTFYNYGTAEYEVGFNGIPEGWTVVTQ